MIKYIYRLIQDENLSLKGNVLIDASYIKSIAKSERASSIGRIPDPLEEVFRFVMCSIEIYWKCNKKNVALKAVGEKKEHTSDFELADFCRGGDLTED